jgi:hypothetical protein
MPVCQFYARRAVIFKFLASFLVASPPGDSPGQWVFDVALQGAVVAKGVDVVKQAGAAEKALVLAFDGIAGGETLTIYLRDRYLNSSHELQGRSNLGICPLNTVRARGGRRRRWGRRTGGPGRR